jgi:hypothetical protein
VFLPLDLDLHHWPGRPSPWLHMRKRKISQAVVLMFDLSLHNLPSSSYTISKRFPNCVSSVDENFEFNPGI